MRLVLTCSSFNLTIYTAWVTEVTQLLHDISCVFLFREHIYDGSLQLMEMCPALFRYWSIYIFIDSQGSLND